jgi:hypothetical protein
MQSAYMWGGELQCGKYGSVNDRVIVKKVQKEMAITYSNAIS